jgi:riboflavin synthase
MFTGIVETTGEVVGVERSAEGRRIRVAAPFAADLRHGESISVSGACLTVEAVGASTPTEERSVQEHEGERERQGGGGGEADEPEAFELFLARETLDRTYLDELDVGDRVNLERAMAADGRFDGHVVQGHVDGTAEVTRVERQDEESGDWTFAFSLPPSLARYVVEKGSITVDGISLTVADLREGGDEFTVAIIPATHDLTTLSEKRVGDPVHLEVDVMAKYVESLLDAEETDPQSRYAERLATQ